MDWKTKIFSLLVLLAGAGISLLSSPVHAQTGRKPNQGDPAYRFQPPRPPPLDADFDDPEEDMMEIGDDGYRPPPPPPPPGGMPPPPPPMPSGTSSFGNTSGTPPKVKFKVVDGEFYEKGKKRGRGKKNQ